MQQNRPQQKVQQPRINQCKICLQTHNNRLIYSSLPCHHLFHTTCLSQQITYSLTKSQYPLLNGIPCPQSQCSTILSLSNIHQLIQQKQLLQKYYDKLFEQSLIGKNIKGFKNIGDFGNMKNIKDEKERSSQMEDNINEESYFYCSTNGCNAIYQYRSICNNDNNDNNDKNHNKNHNNNDNYDFFCLKCRHSFCMDCFNPLHPTMTCKQFKIDQKYLIQDQLFQMYLLDKGKKYKRCPKCNFWVDNWRGCITMKCRCGTQFCFKCGKMGCPHGQCLNIK